MIKPFNILTAAEAAIAIGISRPGVYRAIRVGRLFIAGRFGGAVMISKKEALRYKNSERKVGRPKKNGQ